MRWAGRTIWDTRIQSVCGIITAAAADDEIHIFASASFAQVTLNPPRVIVNPNRTYGIESAVRESGLFAINVLPQSARDMMIQAMRMRRRQHRKHEVLGLPISKTKDGIPYLEGSMRNVFCRVEKTIDSGDRKLYVARVLESVSNPQYSSEVPLLFPQVTDQSEHPRLRRAVRTTLVLTGALDALKTTLQRIRPPAPANIAKATYDEAGATEPEIEIYLRHGATDRSRHLKPPSAPAIINRAVGVCVVGTGWGQTHLKYLQMASPKAKLYVCGQNQQRTERIAKVFAADGYFLNLEAAANDPRIAALTLALPHDLHRSAVEVVTAARKHALVEKPIATTLEDADQMISSAERAGTILMVAEDMHFRPAVREAVKLIEKGAIGEPLYLLAQGGGVRRPTGWAADKERLGGGVLIDIGVHYVRALRLLLGEPDTVVASRAMQVNTRMAGEDSAQLIFSSRFGWDAHMLLSWSTQRGHLPDVVIAGEAGTIHLWPGANYLDYYPVKPRFVTRMLSYVRPYSLQAKLRKPTQQRMRLSVADKDHTGYLGEMQEFLAAVSEGRPPATSAQDGRRDLEIVTRCYEALEKREPVGIPELSKS